MEEFEEMLLTIRAVVGSFKGPVPIQTLANDYEALSSSPMPWQESGHPNLESFLRSFPSLRIIGSGQNAKVDAVMSKESSHISKLISKQKGQTKQVNPLTIMNFNSASLEAIEDEQRSSTEGPSNMCPEDGELDLHNDGVKFSMDWHRQGHKSLEEIGLKMDSKSNESQKEIFSTHCYNNNNTRQSEYFCTDCKEYIDIINNDLRFSIDCHLQKHLILDHSSNFADNNVERKTALLDVLGRQDILENLFSTVKPALKCHRGFFSQNQSGEVKCDVCNVDISPLNIITDHLMNRVHEDNSIVFITSKVPINLCNSMEYISVHESQLWCNLCCCYIDLASHNPYETIVNIMSHNNQKSHHTKKLQVSCDISKTVEMIINRLAQKNLSVNENKHFINFKFKFRSKFKCKLCRKTIGSGLREQKLLKTFHKHFKSSKHQKQRMLRGKELNKRNHFSAEDIMPKLSLGSAIFPPATERNQVVNNTILSDKTNSCPTRDFVQNIEVLLPALTERQRSYIAMGNRGEVSCKPSNFSLPLTVYNIQTDLSGNHHNCASLDKKNPVNNSSDENCMTLLDLPMADSRDTPSSSDKLNSFINCVPLSYNDCISIDDFGITVCLICNCPLSSDTDLQAHITGIPHLQNEAFKSLAQTDPTVGVGSSDVQRFTTHLLDHLDEKRQEENIEPKSIEELQQHEPSIESNKTFIRVEDGLYKCTFCNCILSTSHNAEKLKKNIKVHLEGVRHWANRRVAELRSTEKTFK